MFQMKSCQIYQTLSIFMTNSQLLTSIFGHIVSMFGHPVVLSITIPAAPLLPPIPKLNKTEMRCLSSDMIPIENKQISLLFINYTQLIS